MSTITKERLIKIQQWRETYGPGSNVVLPAEEAEELARIALASLEAEAVADVVAWSSQNEERTCDVRLRRHDIKPGPLYTAPPAPVSVPDAMEMDDDFDSAFEHGKAVGWNAYRAAMLQGAENAESRCTIKTAPALDSLTKNAESRCGNSPVIPEGWVLVPVEPTAEMLQSGISAHYERNQIQIHDRPAPGPMECAYVAMLAAAPQQEVK
ncbi:hypothetical protein E6A33_30585 [Escherichia coli]|nr:hypothetical protein [Escherichia coli]HDS4643040.1 hypothetical protein [Enterobacter asburiae]HDT5664709.1 hypothetical protein [Enterobacter asburiae]